MRRTYYQNKIALKLAKGELVLCPAKNTTHRCWQVFAKMEDLNGKLVNEFVQCRVCAKLFSFKKFTLSNLVKHKCYMEKFPKKPKEIAIPIIENAEENDISIIEKPEENNISVPGNPEENDISIIEKPEENDISIIGNPEENDISIIGNVEGNDISIIGNPEENDISIIGNPEENDISIIKNPGENATLIIKVENSQVELQKIDALDKNHLMKFIAKWIINDCKSYNLIKDTSLRTIFQEFLSLGAKYGPDININKYLPSSKSVARNVNELYTKCSNRLRLELDAIKENGFGLSIHIWRDAYTKHSYIAVTIHYMKSRTLTYSLLGLKSIDGTKKSICKTMEIILKDFDCNLSYKSIIVANYDGDPMEGFSYNKTLPCISHLLNNAVQKSLEEVPDIVKLASDCVKLVELLNKSSTDHCLINSLQTCYPGRWSSMYNMFKSIGNKWNKINQTLKSLNESERLKSIYLHHLKTIIKTLQPFEEAIKALEKNSEATLHLVLIYSYQLRKFCVTIDEEFQYINFIERLKKTLQFHLKNIFTEHITILHKLALFLYPPTNKLLLYSDQHKILIEQECERLCLENAAAATIITTTTTTTLIPQAKTKKVSAAMVERCKLFTDFVELDITPSPRELIKQELQCYKNMRVGQSEDFDCFHWWEMHKDVFPFLYKLSCCILATPASTASTQKVFTATGNLLSEITLDSQLDVTELEKMIFINFNSEKDEFDSEQ